MLDELLDRLWDGVILASIAWTARGSASHVAVAALAALCASFISSYVRARGASLGYTVEESHVTRGIRYALIVAGLAFGWLGWTVWATFGISVLAVLVRTSQVAKEERA
jgi:phosphatidylglycerophosphate synthase